MNKWNSQRLEQCTDILDHMRIPVNSQERAENHGYTPYYGANGLQGYINGWIFDEPLILLAEDGGYFDEYMTRPVAYQISGKSWVNNHAHILRPKIEFDFNFVFYSIEHKNIMPFIKGGTRAKLNQKELREIEIFTPDDMNIQREISSILLVIDESIKKTEALITKYQQIKKGVMHDLFTRGIGTNGKLRPSHEQAPELYFETDSCRIPKEWHCKEISHFTTSAQYGISTGLSDEEQGIPVLRMNNIKRNRFDVSDLKYSSDHAAFLLKLKTGDVLYNRTNSMEHVGKTAIWRNELEECSFASYLVRINLKEDQIDSEYFSHWMSQVSTQNALRRYATPAVQQVNINPTNLQKVLISCPVELEEQKNIVQRIDSIDSKILKEMELLRKLKDQKSGLMYDLLTRKKLVSTDVTETTHV
jgi:type I restriction enzyme S subunit